MIPRYLSPLESKPCNGSRKMIRRLLSVKSDLQETPLPPDPFKKPQPSPPPEKPTDGLAGSEVWWLLYRTKFTEASAHPRCHRHTSSTAVSSTQKPLFFFFLNHFVLTFYIEPYCSQLLCWPLFIISHPPCVSSSPFPRNTGSGFGPHGGPEGTHVFLFVSSWFYSFMHKANHVAGF